MARTRAEKGERCHATVIALARPAFGAATGAIVCVGLPTGGEQ